MRSELGTWGAVVGMAVIACLFGGVTLAIYPGWAAIGHFLDVNVRLSEHAPAWVQAVGSVGAIVAAIWISSDQTRRADRAEVERAERLLNLISTLFHVESIHFLADHRGTELENWRELGKDSGVLSALLAGGVDDLRKIDVSRLDESLLPHYLAIRAAAVGASQSLSKSAASIDRAVGLTRTQYEQLLPAVLNPVYLLRDAALECSQRMRRRSAKQFREV